MKRKIEALSNAFNIGFGIGAMPHNAGKYNYTKAELKRAVEEGLKILSSQQSNPTDGEKCPNCVNGHFYKTIDFCKCGYERRRK